MRDTYDAIAKLMTNGEDAEYCLGVPFVILYSRFKGKYTYKGKVRPCYKFWLLRANDLDCQEMELVRTMKMEVTSRHPKFFPPRLVKLVFPHLRLVAGRIPESVLTERGSVDLAAYLDDLELAQFRRLMLEGVNRDTRFLDDYV